VTVVATLIPRTIHRIWLGPKRMPADGRRYGESWRRYHPDWEMRLWTDADLRTFTNDDFLEGFYRARSFSERADVLRLELLRRFGGVYVDTDFECLRPIDPLIDGLSVFAAYEVPGRICNALIGAIPSHPAMEMAVREARHASGRGQYPESTATVFLTNILSRFPDVTIFGPEKFYPYLWTEPHRRDEEFPEAYAVHHWAATWGDKDVEYYKRRRAIAKRRMQKARREAEELANRLAAIEQRLKAIENSRWWRLRERLLSPVTAVRRAGDGGRQQRP
jgi:mannosyltransferase OCH1-like enzyme